MPWTPSLECIPAGDSINIMSIASGPCTELMDFLEVSPRCDFCWPGVLQHTQCQPLLTMLQTRQMHGKETVHFWCLDDDANCLEFARQRCVRTSLLSCASGVLSRQKVACKSCTSPTCSRIASCVFRQQVKRIIHVFVGLLARLSTASPTLGSVTIPPLRLPASFIKARFGVAYVFVFATHPSLTA